MVLDAPLWCQSVVLVKWRSAKREIFLIDVPFFGTLASISPPRPRRNHWCGTRQGHVFFKLGKPHAVASYFTLVPQKPGIASL